MDIREDQAWLLQSRVNPHPLAGALCLDDGRLSFTLEAGAADAELEWLEKELGTWDLKARLEAGESVVAFDYALGECAVSWPITGGGATMIVRAPGAKWVVTYEYPAGNALTSTMAAFTGRHKAREWKRALAEAGV